MALTLVQRIKTLRTTLTDEDFIRNVRVEVNINGSNEVLKEWNHP